MFKRQHSFATVLALLIAIAFPACNKEKEKPPMATAANANPLEITLTVGPNNSCLQNGIQGGKAAIGADGAKWQGPTSTTAITVTFTTCPFTAGCSFSSGATPGWVPSGPASAPSGTTYAYSSITIGGSQCSVSGDGLVMR
jgi:hypothetical protein